MFRIIYTLMLMGLSHFFVDVMLSIWPVYKSLIQLDLYTAGMIAAIGALIGEAMEVFFGLLSDRGYRKAVIIGGLLLATANGFVAFTTDVGILFLLYLITCLGSAALHPSAAGFVSSLVPNRRGLMMAIFACGGSLGLAFGQIIFTYFYRASPQDVYLIILPAYGVILLLLFSAIGKTESKSIHEVVKFKDLMGFFHNRPMRLLYIALVANQSIYWGMIFILPDALQTLGHGDWVCYGGGHMCLILGGAIMMVPAGYLADRFSPRFVMLVATLSASVIFYALLFSGGIPIHFISPLLFALGASLAVVHPIGVSLGIRLVPEHPSTVSAFLMGVVWCVSEVIGPGGLGLMATLFSEYAAVKALAVLGLLFLANIYAVHCLPREATQVLRVKS